MQLLRLSEPLSAATESGRENWLIPKQKSRIVHRMFPKSDAVFSFYVIVWSRSRLCLFHHVQEIAMHTGILRQFRMERRNQLAALSGCHDLAVHFCQNFCAAGNGSDIGARMNTMGTSPTPFISAVVEKLPSCLP